MAAISMTTLLLQSALAVCTGANPIQDSRVDIQSFPCMVTHHGIWGRSPLYCYVPGQRALRSAGTNRLVVPPVRLSTVGSRAFRLPPLKSGTSCSPSGVT